MGAAAARVDTDARCRAKAFPAAMGENGVPPVICREAQTMAWRSTGRYRPSEEILVMTCDVCERDIGFEDGRRPNDHFRVSRHPNPGAIDDQEPAVIICSRECLRAFASNALGPDRTSSPQGRGGSAGKPSKGR